MKLRDMPPGRARVIASLAILLSQVPAPAAEPAPEFDLPLRSSSQRARLDDFAGQILVLDFFAYWCAPCERASREMESGIQQHYAARKGNARGIPVRVLSVNIEKDQPERTAEFIRKTGISFVAEDPSGELLERLGGVALPFLVVIDGSASRPGAPRFEIVYRQAGFEGVRKLRAILDKLGPATGRNPQPERLEAAVAPDAGPSVERLFEPDVEVVWAGDILLTDSQVRYEQARGATSWDAALAYASFDMDYRPFTDVDGLGYAESIHEDRYALRGNLRRLVAENWMVLGSAGGYLGYPDYRRVWIANRYRQVFGGARFPRVPPYEKPEPKGYNASLGARWEYLPAVGFAEVKAGYAHDTTAPGYEIFIDDLGMTRLLKNREQLDTWSVAGFTENVLTRRIRSRNEVNLSGTTGREPRFSYQGSLNVALGERWVVRGYGGVTVEQPTFDAHFFGLTAECEVLPSVFVSATGRYYKDTGEIENSISVTSAAPPLTSWEAGLGLRWQVGRSTFKVNGGPFWTDYHRRPGVGREFTFLYNDRNWGLAQIAWSMSF